MQTRQQRQFLFSLFFYEHQTMLLLKINVEFKRLQISGYKYVAKNSLLGFRKMQDLSSLSRKGSDFFPHIKI